jgi:hypothetical protein
MMMLVLPTAIRSSQRSFAVLVAALLLAVGVSTGCDKSDAPAEGSAESASADEKLDQEASDEGAAEQARFDASLEEDTCELVTKKMVATVLSVPEGELEQDGGRRTPCSYDWEGDDTKLHVELVRAEVFDTETLAAGHFLKMTPNMSSEEVAEAMKGIRKTAETAGQLNSKNKKMAAKKLGEGMAEGGFEFKDVEGVGDEARYEVTTNELHVRVDNLYFMLAAYKGPTMELPDKISGASMKKAANDFHKETRPQRLEASKKVAQAAVESL